MRQLDRIDIAILEALQRNGRATRRELSEEVGISATPCHDRIKRLEKDRFINRYAAKININRAVKVSFAYVTLTLERHRAADFDNFERAVRRYDEIIECHALGGGIDYLLKIVVTSIDEYQTFIEELLSREVGVSQYFTHFVTKPVKEFEGYPLAQLMEN